MHTFSIGGFFVHLFCTNHSWGKSIRNDPEDFWCCYLEQQQLGILAQSSGVARVWAARGGP